MTWPAPENAGVRVVVIGAGVGGLTAAALLAKAGLEVTVLEHHTYPGGCAGTFTHQGYAFDAGATLLAGFDEGGVFSRLGAELGLQFPVRKLLPGEPLMEVWLPGERRVLRRVGPAYELADQLEAFGPQVEGFWRWQQQRSEALWALAQGLPFPPATAQEAALLVQKLGPWAWQHRRDLLEFGADGLYRASRYAPPDPAFRRFLDAQLLIASQAEAQQTYALFAAAALDLPHRGAVMPQGGMGAVARTLAQAVERYGGSVRYRHRVEGLRLKGPQVQAVEVALGGRRRGEKEVLEADVVLANLTPGDLLRLAYPRTQTRPPSDGWGAFVLHAALPDSAIPAGPPYRQRAVEAPWVFVSLSEVGDTSRAPSGMRLLSASVHTPLKAWQGLSPSDYARQKQFWQSSVEGQLEPLIPNFAEAALVLAATPRTYAFYTRRHTGWVGGYPQTHPLRTPSPKTPFANVWRVGETIFPGQSVPAVALGGWRVAQLLLARINQG